LKRSNRLVLLVGLFLAVVAFVGVFILLSGNPSNTGPGNEQKTPTVFATKDIPLGVTVTADMVRTDAEWPTDQRAADAFSDSSLVIGQVARRNISTGAQLTSADFASGTGLTSITCPPTLRCISVQVDQVSGVGTLIQAGDFVDMLVGFTADKFPVVTVNPTDNTITPITGLNATTVKLLLQGLQVQGVLLPPVATDQNQNQNNGSTSQPATNLNGQQEIVIVSASAQQAEVIKYAQMDGAISLVLRSAKDFQDPNDPTQPVTPIPDVTTGIILKTLVDEYGVLVPQVVEAILPGQ